jgi:hypothetical protein
VKRQRPDGLNDLAKQGRLKPLELVLEPSPDHLLLATPKADDQGGKESQ